MKLIKNRQAIEGGILSLVSIIFIRESLKLHNRQSWALSPALFPLLITSMLLLFSLILIFKKDKKAKAYRNRDNKKLMLVLTLSFLYFISLERFSFLLSTGLYLFGFMYLLGERRWWINILFVIIIPVGIQYIFGNLLGVILP